MKEYNRQNIKAFRKKKKKPTISCRECLESAPTEHPNRVKCYRWDTLVAPSRAECCPYFVSKRKRKIEQRRRRR